MLHKSLTFKSCFHSHYLNGSKHFFTLLSYMWRHLHWSEWYDQKSRLPRFTLSRKLQLWMVPGGSHWTLSDPNLHHFWPAELHWLHKWLCGNPWIQRLRFEFSLHKMQPVEGVIWLYRSFIKAFSPQVVYWGDTVETAFQLPWTLRTVLHMWSLSVITVEMQQGSAYHLKPVLKASANLSWNHPIEVVYYRD